MSQYLGCEQATAGSIKNNPRSYGGIAEGVHLFPFRTEKLSPSWPMVLHNNAGEQVAAIFILKASDLSEAFLVYTQSESL